MNHLEAIRSETRPYHDGFVRMLEILPCIGNLLLQLEWRIALAPPGKTFVTGDCPALICRPVGHNPLLGVGLATPGAEKVVPLTKQMGAPDL
jgi:hypothetical protein